jgi:hypothetical protein
MGLGYKVLAQEFSSLVMILTRTNYSDIDSYWMIRSQFQSYHMTSGAKEILPIAAITGIDRIRSSNFAFIAA